MFNESLNFNLRGILENETKLKTNRALSSRISQKNSKEEKDDVQSFFDLPIIYQILAFILGVVIIAFGIALICGIFKCYNKKKVKDEKKDEKETKEKNIEMIPNKNDYENNCGHIDLSSIDIF